MRPENDFDLSIVTVTYNERENIALLIRELNEIFSKSKIHAEIIVVDDSSPDGTAEEVRKLAKKYKTTRLILRNGKLGIASAYRDGINSARGRIIIPMDADFNHPPSRVAEFYRVASSGKIAFGSRYIGKRVFETDFAHFIGTTVINKWVSLLLQTGIKDNTNGFFAVPANLLGKIRSYSNKKGIDPFDTVLSGIVISACAKKLKIPVVELEAPYEKRRFGKSKIPFLSGLKIVLGNMMFTLKLRSKLRQSEIK